MLAKLEKEIPDLKLRLLGLRCTNLVSTKKIGLEFFSVTSRPKPTPGSSNSTTTNTEQNIEMDEAFEQAARQERQQEIEDLEQLSQEIDDSKESHNAEGSDAATEPPILFWDCPICSKPQPADDKIFNDHVDFCLSKDAIKKTVQGVSQEAPPESNSSSSKTRKRKTTSQSSADPRQKRLFFT